MKTFIDRKPHADLSVTLSMLFRLPMGAKKNENVLSSHSSHSKDYRLYGRVISLSLSQPSPRALVRAAAQAQKAFDYLHALMEEPKVERPEAERLAA